MASNIETILARLVADSTLLGAPAAEGYAGLAKGGIWDRKIKRNGPGNTPQAFWTADQGRMIRPCISIRDMGEVLHRQESAIPSAYNQFVWIYYYAPALASGKEAIRDMRRRVYELIDFTYSGWTFASEDGPVVFPRLLDRRGTHDSETFPEAVEDYQRFELTSRYAHLT